MSKPAATQTTALLRIMATTDLHMHLRSYDYYTDKPSGTNGLSRIATLIRSARQGAQNTLLFDNGDFLQGNPMGDLAANGGFEGAHPAIRAFNFLGYNAVTLGNHEFNFGIDFLRQSLCETRFPVLCANVFDTDGSPFCQKFALLDQLIHCEDGTTSKIKIGVTGFVPPQIEMWDKHHLNGVLKAQDILESAHKIIPELQKNGADIVIALCHSGIGSSRPEKGEENVSAALAEIEGIDVVITGHSHGVFPNDAPPFDSIDPQKGTLSGKPSVMAGSYGSHLGLIDLEIETRQGRWQVKSHNSSVQPTSAVSEDQDFLEATETFHQKTLTYVRQPIGHCPFPMNSYFSLLGADAGLELVQHAQATHVAKAIADTKYASLPLLSAASPFKTGGKGRTEYYTDIPAGPLAIRDLANLYPYPNLIRAVKVTGTQLKNWLERSAGLFNQITPGSKGEILLDPVFPGYDFDWISGVEYQIDISQPSKYTARTGQLLNPSANRIQYLSFSGLPVQADQEFVVAVKSHRANGGGHFPGLDGSGIIYEGTASIRDLVIEQLKKLDGFLPTGRNWSFAPLNGAEPIFETSTTALNHPEIIRALRLNYAQSSTDGFAQFRLVI